MTRSWLSDVPTRFADRREAGRLLGRRLLELVNRRDVVVLGLPRGGVPVAYEVAQTLGARLDVLVVRKLALPGYPELAMGAIASGGVRVMNEDVLAWSPPSAAAIEAVVAAECAELERRERAYRLGRPPVPIDGRTVILVDDGLATGSTMCAAVLAVRRLRPLQVLVAIPVGASDACDALRGVVDDVVCLLTPSPFSAVGQWYIDFAQTSDEEVRRLLSAQAVGASTRRSA